MNSAASDPVLIGIDWGTTSLRAFLIGARGNVLDSVSSTEGIMQVPSKDFDEVFARLVGPWAVGNDLPILASGMITSRNGWVETPYVEMPVAPSNLAQSLVTHVAANGKTIHFITGAITEHSAGPDVMRGEETQIIGASEMGLSDGVFVMPGTHSKWVHVSGGRIEDFATYMTGEVFAALKSHTILGALMEPGNFNQASFDRGVSDALNLTADLLHHLFYVRTLPLMGKLTGAEAADYLSGLLIGSEIAAAVQYAGVVDAVTIVGRSDLADRYEIALKAAGLESHRASENVVARGHFQIAKSAGLLT